jgi:citrate lyase synthetase
MKQQVTRSLLKQLREETDFVSYIRLLRQFISRYTLFVLVADTPCGSYFTVDMGKELFTLGLKVNLTDISVRFVGEEPFDQITKQYNETLKVILPQYGIQLIEIPRLETEGVPISASRVRSFLDSREWYEIETMVPETTLSYLKDLFGKDNGED